MRLTHRFEVSDASHVGEARRRVGERAADLGFDEADRGRIAIVITEATRNLLKHARGGQLLVNELIVGGTSVLQLLALDSGPGLRDAGSAMRDGYSTAGTPGTGLGAMRRMADRFALYSGSRGTAVLAEFGPAKGRNGGTGFDAVGAVALSKPGEDVSGDGWRVLRPGSDWLVMVADGLGHGLQAADAAAAALATLDRPFPSLPELMQDVHGALRASRGAAVGIARASLSTVEYVGVGNIVCRVAAPARGAGMALDKQLVSHNGTVGHSLRKTDPFRAPLPAGAVVILHSDGLSSRFALGDFPGLLEQPAALIAGVLFHAFARHTDDATIVVLRADWKDPKHDA